MVSATLSGHSLHEEVQFLEWKTSVASSLVMAMTVTTVRLLSRLDGRACGVACVGLGLEQPLRALLGGRSLYRFSVGSEVGAGLLHAWPTQDCSNPAGDLSREQLGDVWT